MQRLRKRCSRVFSNGGNTKHMQTGSQPQSDILTALVFLFVVLIESSTGTTETSEVTGFLFFCCHSLVWRKDFPCALVHPVKNKPLLDSMTRQLLVIPQGLIPWHFPSLWCSLIVFDVLKTFSSLVRCNMCDIFREQWGVAPNKQVRN